MRQKFTVGQELSAAELNSMVQRIEALRVQARQGPQRAPRELRVESSGMRHAFQIAEVGGALCVRRGWVWDGQGGLLPVGEHEWNEVEDPGGDIDVWLDVGGQRSGGSVRVVRRDATAPSGRLHVRLGYRETRADGEEVCVQVAGGLIVPCQPVMARGSLRANGGLVAGGSNSGMGQTDWQLERGRCAAGGCAQIQGYSIDPWGQKMRNDFFLYYYAGQAVGRTREGHDSMGTTQRVLRLDNTPWDAWAGEY